MRTRRSAVPVVSGIRGGHWSAPLAVWLAVALFLVVPAADVGRHADHDFALVHPLFPHAHGGEHARSHDGAAEGAAAHVDTLRDDLTAGASVHDRAAPSVVAPVPGEPGGVAGSGRSVLSGAVAGLPVGVHWHGLTLVARRLTDQYAAEVAVGPPRAGGA